MHARRTGVSRAFSEERAAERVRSFPFVRVSGEPKPQTEERAGRGAHWPGEETAITRTVQTSQALSSVRGEARYTQDALRSGSGRGPSARSSSPRTAEQTDCRMTPSVLCIARVFLDRTIPFEPARACSESPHGVVFSRPFVPVRQVDCAFLRRFVLLY